MASDDEFLQATLPALDLVHNLARRFGHERADAEDLVQDTYLRAWQAWTNGNRPQQVEAWLATICLNLGRDRLRRASKRLEVVGDPAQEPAAEVDVAAAAIGRVERVGVLHGVVGRAVAGDDLPEPGAGPAAAGVPAAGAGRRASPGAGRRGGRGGGRDRPGRAGPG